jgi:hypothetical protein
MSEPPYHLRINKYVERHLFVELLKRVGAALPMAIADYPYVGLGGPYLADFALLQDEFGFLQMTSLETESHVRRRQQFNLPHCRVAASKRSTNDFVESFAGTKPAIVWFDYSRPLWAEQIEESCDLIAKMSSLSIFKITLACVTGPTGPLGRGATEERIGRFNEMFEDYGPFSGEAIIPTNLPRTLYGILKKTIAYRLGDNPNHTAKTLASFAYNDGTPILTVALAVGAITAIDGLIQKSGMRSWSFADLNWRGPRLIDVPVLTFRERLAIDRLLPDANAQVILNTIDLALSQRKTEVIGALEQYIKYRKYMPFFVDIRTYN